MVEPLAAVASWATPNSLFVLINVVIGVIAITSVFASRNNDHPPTPDRQQRHHESPGRLVRAPSLLSRVISFNFSHLNSNYYYESSAADEADPYTSSFVNDAVSPPENPPIARAPSILSRMTSFNGFSLYRSVEPENPPAIEKKQSEIARAPSLLSRMTSFNRFNRSAEPENALATDNMQPSIARAPSLLSRMASINFSLYRSAEPEPSPASESAPVESREHHVTRSVTEPKEKKKKAQESQMKKSSSKKTGKAKETASFGRGCEEEVDAKADDFINWFKQQLRLQRLDSLRRHRNSAAAAASS